MPHANHATELALKEAKIASDLIMRTSDQYMSQIVGSWLVLTFAVLAAASIIQ